MQEKPDSKVAVPPGPDVPPLWQLPVANGVFTLTGRRCCQRQPGCSGSCRQGIILADIGPYPCSQRVEEESKAAANHQLGIDLIGEATRGAKLYFCVWTRPWPYLFVCTSVI